MTTLTNLTDRTEADVVYEAVIDSAGYDAKRPIVRDVRFEARGGQRVGLIGPNGAGKSTVMKGLLGQLPSFDGKLLRNGEALTEAAAGISSRIAYIPEQPLLYERLTLWEHLVLAAAAGELPEEPFRDRADRLLRRFRLDKFRHECPIRFSKGMQQKTMLIVGLLLEPELLLVDEPFIGLDPGAVVELLDALDEQRDRGAAVVLTTHVLDSAECICDRFVLVHGGGVAAAGRLDDIRRAAGCPDDATLFDCFVRLTDSREEEAE